MFRHLVIAAALVAGARGLAEADPVSVGSAEPICAQITALIDESVALKLSPRVERAFTLTLHAADAAVHDGETGRALTLLRTFAFEVRSVTRAKRLPEDAAHVLIARAESAIRVLNR